MADFDTYLCALVHSALLDCIDQPRPLQGWGTLVCLQTNYGSSAVCYPRPGTRGTHQVHPLSPSSGSYDILQDGPAPRPGVAKLPSLKSR